MISPHAPPLSTPVAVAVLVSLWFMRCSESLDSYIMPLRLTSPPPPPLYDSNYDWDIRNIPIIVMYCQLSSYSTAS